MSHPIRIRFEPPDRAGVASARVGGGLARVFWGTR